MAWEDDEVQFSYQLPCLFWLRCRIMLHLWCKIDVKTSSNGVVRTSVGSIPDV